MSILDQAGLPLTLGVAALAVIAVVRRQFALALGILLAGASLSGITADVRGTGVRIEQPAVILVAGMLLAREREACVSMIRFARWPILLALVFLAANVASAVLFAPNALQSLKICLWLSISLLAALVAATLVKSADGRDIDRQVAWWIVGASVVHSLVAAVQVGGEVVLQSGWGVLRSDASIGKAFGLAWEPNLLAILLASALMFLLDPVGRRLFRSDVRVGLLVLISAGIALALSRGGIVAAIAGVAFLVIAQARRRPDRTGASRMALVRSGALAMAIAVGGYAGLSWLAANGVGLRPGEVASAQDKPQGTLVPFASVDSSVRPSTPAPTTSANPPSSGPTTLASSTPEPSATHAPSYLGASDTIELRARNLQIAVRDGLTSPILGLGPDSFGQRYEEPTCACPAHIPNQLSATFYESGIVGLGSLLLLLGWVLIRAWQRRLDAFVAALVTLLVGFQFTDALRFGATWLLIGTMVGLIVMTGQSLPRVGQAPSDTP